MYNIIFNDSLIKFTILLLERKMALLMGKTTAESPIGGALCFRGG